MNRAEFMRELEKLLVSISEDERAEALKYYEDYFEDAGAENEEQVIKELGSPEKVAAIIWADTRGDSEKSGEFTENGYTDVRFEEKAHPACREEQDTAQEKETSQSTKSAGNTDKTSEHAYSYHGTTQSAAGQGTANHSANQNTWQHNESGYGAGEHTQSDGYRAGRQKDQMRTNKALKVILIIVLVLVILKVFDWLLPTAFSVIAGIVGLIIGFLGLLIGVAAAGGGLAVAGVVIVIAGIGELTTTFATAILVMGIGLLMTGIGIALAVLAVKLSLVVYPAIFRAVVNFVSRLFHRKEANDR